MATERVLDLDDVLFSGDVRRARRGDAGDGPGGHLGRLASWRGLLVLDHGCGDAPLKAILEARGATHVGLDPYGASAALAAPGEAIPLADTCVDVVISQGVLHLVPHPPKDFAAISRVLRPGGRLMAYVAFTESFQESSTFHVSHHGLELLCSDAGLVLTEIRPSARGLDYHAAETFLPMGKGGPLRPLLRRLVRGVATLSSAAWAAAFATVRCRRDGRWSEWDARRAKWAWYSDLSLASGFEFVAVKPGEWIARESVPPLTEFLRCPISGEPLRRESSSAVGVDAWLVGPSRARAYPIRGGQMQLRAGDATTAP